MSDTATIDSWFLAEDDEDETGYGAAARTRSPLIAEVWRNGEWIRNEGSLWQTLHEENGWEPVDQTEVEAWIASRGGAAPGSTG